MTTTELRKKVKVTNWSVTDNGIFVSYHMGEMEGTAEYSMYLPISDGITELRAIGSLEDDEEWNIKTFVFSQWDALTLVVRLEYLLSLNQDAIMLEMDAALDAIKNSHF